MTDAASPTGTVQPGRTAPANPVDPALADVPHAGWHVGTVVATRPETPSAARLELEVEGWPGNAAGQHLDVRLTAPDGYMASRSYSIASSGSGTRVVLAVDRLPDGEVSPFLVDILREGDLLEVHGPLGAFFIWRPDGHRRIDPVRPVQLIAGGSGVVPLFAMAQAHADAADLTPFRMLYSARTPDDVFFADELTALAAGSDAFRLDLVYTRRIPEGWPAPPGRVTRDLLEASVLPADDDPIVYVCGSTGFVERVTKWLLELGHDARSIRTERYGGT